VRRPLLTKTMITAWICALRNGVRCRGACPGGLLCLDLRLLQTMLCLPKADLTYLPLATRATANGGRGRIEPVGNVLVADAARDGATALDGDERNSPSAAAGPLMQIDGCSAQASTDAILRTPRIPDGSIGPFLPPRAQASGGEGQRHLTLRSVRPFVIDVTNGARVPSAAKR
jgi:hypothetical protein